MRLPFTLRKTDKNLIVGWLPLVILLACPLAQAQTSAQATDAMTVLPLTDLSAFKPTAGNWQVAGGVNAEGAVLKADKGTGTLVNLPTDKKRDNLTTVMEHGDLDLELDFMMAKGSNSGIYLQGRYEIQLLDSWGVKSPSVHDCGAIYERWDESRPDGQKGYEGQAPRLNACRAPGLWQHYRISFQAPRFNAQGQKTQNARLVEVQLNGMTIHENVELTGPTRGPLAANEVAKGPLHIQGDHGPVAFRNIRYLSYDKAAPTISGVKYSYFDKFDKTPNFAKLKPTTQGNAPGLTWEVSPKPDDFLVRLTGTMQVPEAGKYDFRLFSSGEGNLKIGSQTVVSSGWGDRNASVTLPAGEQPFEIVYGKSASWASPGLGMGVSGAGIRQQMLSALSSIPQDEPVNPILLSAKGEPTLLRSFMDVKRGQEAKSKRVVHAISVGSPTGTHYTLDLDNAALVQVWKGGFLNTTPMWHDRGDGSSRPLGAVITLGDAPLLATLASATAPWPDQLPKTASAVTPDFRTRGYDLDAEGNPTFKYTCYGTEVEDQLTAEDGGKRLTRSVRLTGTPTVNLYCRLAEGKDIVALPDGSYRVNDHEYFLTLPADVKPTLRTVGGRQELLLPVAANQTIRYSLTW